MFQRLLVPLDTSALAECVLPHLEALARAWPIEATLLHVLEGERPDRGGGVDPLRWEAEKGRAGAYLTEIADRLRGTNLTIETQVREGRAADEILNALREGGHDLVLLSSHGSSGVSGFNLGSVGYKVVSHGHAGMLLVRAFGEARTAHAAEPRYQRILVPLDGSTRAECVLPIAASLARAHDAEVVACHILCRAEIPHLLPFPEDEAALLERVHALTRRQGERYIKDVTRRLTGEDVRAHGTVCAKDSATAAAHDLVVETGADLVILSAHGRTGGARWPFGSMVVNFLAYGSTPLLVIQDLGPEGIEPSEAERAARQRSGH